MYLSPSRDCRRRVAEWPGKRMQSASAGADWVSRRRAGSSRSSARSPAKKDRNGMRMRGWGEGEGARARVDDDRARVGREEAKLLLVKLWELVRVRVRRGARRLRRSCAGMDAAAARSTNCRRRESKSQRLTRSTRSSSSLDASSSSGEWSPSQTSPTSGSFSTLK